VTLRNVLVGSWAPPAEAQADAGSDTSSDGDTTTTTNTNHPTKPTTPAPTAHDPTDDSPRPGTRRHHHRATTTAPSTGERVTPRPCQTPGGAPWGAAVAGVCLCARRRVSPPLSVFAS